MITSESVTDEQIRELRKQAQSLFESSYSAAADRGIADVCDIALGVTPLEPCLNVHPSHDCIGGQRREARARCAELINARTKEST